MTTKDDDVDMVMPEPHGGKRSETGQLAIGVKGAKRPAVSISS